MTNTTTNVFLDDDEPVKVRLYDGQKLSSRKPYATIEVGPVTFFTSLATARRVVQQLAALHEAELREYVSANLSRDLAHLGPEF